MCFCGVLNYTGKTVTNRYGKTPVSQMAAIFLIKKKPPTFMMFIFRMPPFHFNNNLSAVVKLLMDAAPLRPRGRFPEKRGPEEQANLGYPARLNMDCERQLSGVARTSFQCYFFGGMIGSNR